MASDCGSIATTSDSLGATAALPTFVTSLVTTNLRVLPTPVTPSSGKTPDQTSGPSPPPFCTSGVQFQFYKLAKGDAWGPGRIPLNGDYLKPPFHKGDVLSALFGELPLLTGTTKFIGFTNGPADIRTIYGKSTQNTTDYFIIKHTGYFYSPQGGTYQVQVTRDVDEAAWMWWDQKARFGYTSQNADLRAGFQKDDGTYTFSVGPNTYTPYRIMWANAQEYGGFPFVWKGPGGETIVSATQPANGQLFVSCNILEAPYFD